MPRLSASVSSSAVESGILLLSAGGMSGSLSERAFTGELQRRVVDIDRTQRTAHRAYVGARRLALLFVTARLVGIHRHRVHPLPVERLAKSRHLIVPLFRAAHALNEVARMRRDSRRDNALAHVVDIGEPQMLRRRHVAEKIRARRRRDRTANRSCDVVIS